MSPKTQPAQPRRIPLPNGCYFEQLSEAGSPYWYRPFFADGTRMQPLLDDLIEPYAKKLAAALAPLPEITAEDIVKEMNAKNLGGKQWVPSRAHLAPAPAVPPSALTDAYVGLLQLPQSKWRIENQPLYAILRDAVAVNVGMTPEQTQDSCESVARWFAHPIPTAAPTAEAATLARKFLSTKALTPGAHDVFTVENGRLLATAYLRALEASARVKPKPLEPVPELPSPESEASAHLAAGAGVEQVKHIEHDEKTCRSYIPLAGGYEFQTKGTGSTARLLCPDGTRVPFSDPDHVIKALEEMAFAQHAALTAPAQPNTLIREAVESALDAFVEDLDREAGFTAYAPTVRAVQNARKIALATYNKPIERNGDE